MKFKRSSGIILHPTSLPGPYGIGDLGPEAFAWIDFLAQTGCGLWQILPLGPTGYGDSPYQCFSAFAGNPYLISPERLLDDKLLLESDLEGMPDFPLNRVDFGAVIPWKLALLDRAYARFKKSGPRSLKQAYKQFQEQHAAWLEDFALFMALKEHYRGKPWTTWYARTARPPTAGSRESAAEAGRIHQTTGFPPVHLLSPVDGAA